MAKLNCNVGDLAVIVDAYNPENIGTFVRVINPHHNQGAIAKHEDDLLWLVKGSKSLIYDRNGKKVKRRKGAAPDSVLRPIRGLYEGKDIADGVFIKETTID